MPALERAFYDEVIGDLCALPPTVLVVESVTHYGAEGRRPFDSARRIYRQDERFARLWTAYAPADRVGAFSVYVARAQPTCGISEPQPATGR